MTLENTTIPAPVDVTLQDFSALLKKRANALTPAERMSAFMLGANAAQAIIDKQEGRPMLTARFGWTATEQRFILLSDNDRRALCASFQRNIYQ